MKTRSFSPGMIGFVLSIVTIFIVSCSSATPPQNGAFLKNNNQFKEIPTIEMVDYPSRNTLTDYATTDDNQPVITLSKINVITDQLMLYAVDQNKKLPLDTKTINKELYEIKPASPLDAGMYCLIQGDPTAAVLSAWCFDVNLGNTNITHKTEPTAVAAAKPSLAASSTPSTKPNSQEGNSTINDQQPKIATINQQGELCIKDFNNQIISTIPTYIKSPSLVNMKLMWSPNGQYLLFSSNSYAKEVFLVDTQERTTRNWEVKSPFSLIWSPASDKILAQYDKGFEVLSLNGKQMIGLSWGWAQWSLDGNSIYAIWNPEDTKSELLKINASTAESEILSIPDKKVSYFIQNPDGKLVIVYEGFTQLYDPSTKEASDLTIDLPANGTFASLSPSVNKVLYLVNEEKAVYLLDLLQTKSEKIWTGEKAFPPSAYIWSPDEQKVGISIHMNGIYNVDLNSKQADFIKGEPYTSFQRRNPVLLGTNFSPDSLFTYLNNNSLVLISVDLQTKDIYIFLSDINGNVVKELLHDNFSQLQYVSAVWAP